MPVEDYLLSAFMQTNQEFEIVRITAFINEVNEAAVMSMTFVFPSEDQLKTFDESLQNIPDEFAELDMSSLFPAESGLTIKIEPFLDLPAIGNNSVAFRMILSIEDINIHYEIVMFRRGPVGAAVFVFGLSESAQIPSLADLAILLDQRIIMAFDETE
jgi:hypothetical protein